MSLFFALKIFLGVLIVGIALYLITPRRYQSSESVANSYDEWTEDGILPCPRFPLLFWRGNERLRIAVAGFLCFRFEANLLLYN